MTRVLTQPRWHDVVVAIMRLERRTCYCQRLIRHTSMSMTHLRETLKRLTRHELIVKTKVKNTDHLCLTEKGKRVCGAIQILREELKEFYSTDSGF